MRTGWRADVSECKALPKGPALVAVVLLTKRHDATLRNTHFPVIEVDLSVNPWVIKARSFARKTGVIGLINRLRPSGSYERRAHEALIRAVKPGDVLWDVGANIGVYSELFCQWVGEDGLVMAFEPWAESCQRIRERVQNCAWLQVENIALGEADANGRLVIGAESVENHIETEVSAPKGTAATIPVVIPLWRHCARSARANAKCDQGGCGGI